jgi:NADH-quinone oxidoreductase subunit A
VEDSLTQIAPIWPLLLFFGAAVLLATLMIGVSYFLGQRHNDRDTGLPYESGISSLGSAHLRVSAKFYLIALFFVIFDIEAIFIFSWAVSFRQLGWRGYFEVLIFIGVLFLALLYLWRNGALDWGPEQKGIP